MFDLEHEVATWSATVHAERCRPGAGVAELSDHLYCEIDRARAKGLSDEEAFHTAIVRLGSAEDLTVENAKNRSALGTACRLASKLDRQGSSPEHRRLLMAHAVVWAAVMVASALLLKNATASQTYTYLLILVFLPLSWSSEQILRRALRQGAAGER